MISPQIPIAKEGYPFIAFSAFVTLILAVLGYDLLALPALALTTFIICFFRDPERIGPISEDALISPADGKVILIEKIIDDQYLLGQVYKISIFMNVFNVHVNRVPVSGTVEKILYTPGKFYSADSDRGALYNEHCATILSCARGNRLAFVQVAGLIARRIVCWLEVDDQVRRGQRFGLIRFGSRVDLYIPTQTQLEIAIGQKVRAGETVLGYLP
ncbi:MAG: phosphatidylserine decarboxylase family protein [Deltaproteobacteria bacterium]|nr:phosphatidylserine decarboxylase family protein [Deltaproteobacteria bacterium]